MKKITFILFIVSVSFALNAQNSKLIADFENNDTYFVRSSANMVEYKIVDNPDDANDVNKSAKVLEIKYLPVNYPNYAVVVRDAATEPQIAIPLGNTGGVEQGKYRYAHMKVYMPFNGSILLSLKHDGTSGNDGHAPQYINQATDAWEDIVIDLFGENGINMRQNFTYYGMMLNLDKTLKKVNVGFTAYIDDIVFSNSADPITSGLKRVELSSNISVTEGAPGRTIVHVREEINGNMSIDVYGPTGQLVKNAYRGAAAIGNYEISGLTKGIHLIRVTSNKGYETFKCNIQ